MYKVREMFYTLQGEGANAGRPAVFCRFSGCNLWSGREQDRASAICTFCDTQFRGTDGEGGGSFATAQELATTLKTLWPQHAPDSKVHPLVVCTGGEPLLQLDSALIDALHQAGFEIAIETNGTLPIPEGIDWSVVSPKGRSKIVVDSCDELKLVFPQPEAMPERFHHIQARHYYLSPLVNPHRNDDSNTDLYRDNFTRQAIDYCLKHPRWRLNLQTHKIVNIA